MTGPPFRCKFDYCEKIFMRRQDLIMHLNEVHDIEKEGFKWKLVHIWGYATKEEIKDKKVSFSLGALL